MSEFKGTKGKWELVRTTGHPENECEQIAFIQTPKVCMDISDVEIDTFTRNEFKANAQLISKAPEMLEMLIKVLDNLLPECTDKNQELIISEIEQLIKEATTI